MPGTLCRQRESAMVLLLFGRGITLIRLVAAGWRAGLLKKQNSAMLHSQKETVCYRSSTMQIATMRLWKPSTLIGEGNRGFHL